MKNKNVKVGLVGLGRVGQQHAENIAYRIPNCELTAICSIETQEIKECQRKMHVPFTYTNYDEMLTNKSLDAIFIASPSRFHCTHIQKALHHGFHVFSEKPLGLYMEEAIEIEKVVKSYPYRVFMIGFMRRYDHSYAVAKQKIDQGDIGEPVMIRCYGLDPAGRIDNFLEFARKNYSGGLFIDMSIHDLDLARWILGAEAKEVWAIGGSYARTEFKDINDAETGTAMIRFENNRMGIFVAGRNCAHGYHVETEIMGTEGSIRIGTTPSRDHTMLMQDNSVVNECYTGFLERFEEAYLKEVEEFINCILEARQPGVTVRDGIESLRLGYACKQSFETGKLITL